MHHDPSIFPEERFAGRKTPFLLLSGEVVRQKGVEFTSFAPQIQTFYSVKANPAPQLLSYMNTLGLSYEVSSLPELRRVLSLGVSEDRVSTSNPVKSPEFIRYAYRKGLRQFVVDSRTEVAKITRYAPGSAVLVRLTVDNSESAWPLEEKYGVEAEETLALLLLAQEQGLQPLGLTFHVGSQCTGLTSWRAAIDKAASVWRQAQERGISLRLLNVGGGFPAHHTPNVPTSSEILQVVTGCADELLPHGTALQAEPGRGLVGNAGVLVASVIGTARRNGQRWMYLDVGVFNGLMEAVGGLQYTIAPLNRQQARRDDIWVVAGPTCDSFDVVSRETTLPDLSIGERVAISPGGAYTTAYASRFNGATIPRTFLV